MLQLLSHWQVRIESILNDQPTDRLPCGVPRVLQQGYVQSRQPEGSIERGNAYHPSLERLRVRLLCATALTVTPRRRKRGELANGR